MSDLNKRPNTLQVNTLNGINNNNDESVNPNFFEKATRLLNSTRMNKSLLPLPRTKSWGQTITKDKFQDMDMLESGFARAYISEECLSPTPSTNDWKNCYVSRVNKIEYKMYDDETNRFLLSARQQGDTFYISLYENFTEQIDTPSTNYCAILRRTDNRSNFKLYSCGCEGCDTDFGKFSCNDLLEHDEAGTEHHHDHASADRQLLADITHQTKKIEHIQADMRSLSVIIPAVMADKRSRVVWCPRVHGSTTPTGGTPRFSQKKVVTSPSPLHKNQNINRTPFSFDAVESDRLKLESKLPEWNNDLRSLVLKFHGGRVLAASSKNFLLSESSKKDRGILQFGKARKGRFVLDFRYPLAPIQAFGIALSSCAWSAE